MLALFLLACAEPDKPNPGGNEPIDDPQTDDSADSGGNPNDSADTDVDCPPGEVNDCNGNCAPSSWVGDGECDEETYEHAGNLIDFNCAEHNFDGGDCGDPCAEAIDISTSSYQSTSLDVTWNYSNAVGSVVAGPVYVNLASNLESVAFSIETPDHWTLPIYLEGLDESKLFIGNNTNLPEEFWARDINTTLLPVSPQTEPPTGCTAIMYYGSDDNDYEFSEGTTSTLRINARASSSDNKYVVNFIVVNNSSISESELGTVWQHTQDYLTPMNIDISNTYIDSINTGTGSYVEDDSPEAIEILSTPPPSLADDREINVYFVDDFIPSYSLYGYAGGLPGALGVQNTPASGVIVSIDIHRTSNGFDYDEFGATIAHEMGHQLGLFHTTEADGSSNDILSDTPDCNLSYDSNGDGELTPSECQSQDGPYVMFWTTPGGAFAQESWSNQQADVLRSSPIIVQ